MGSKERRERERDDLRTKILDAARQLILEQGVDAVSMRKIAERIEYSPTAIYQHFADKEALLHAMCERDFDGLHCRLLERMAGVTDPVEAIVVSGISYVVFATEYPSHFRVMFMTPNAHPAEMTEADKRKKADPSASGYAAFKMNVTRAIEAGRFRDEYSDPEMITQVLWGVVHGVASIHVAKQKDPWVELTPIDKWLRVAITATMRGMLRDPEEIERVYQGLGEKGAML
ncbi:MAG TPA: TetR/AcrR family transcriptional regulator [Tepidisphaeraceae bacterium]|jgi:AcrR family transcriptional regulator